MLTIPPKYTNGKNIVPNPVNYNIYAKQVHMAQYQPSASRYNNGKVQV